MNNAQTAVAYVTTKSQQIQMNPKLGNALAEAETTRAPNCAVAPGSEITPYPSSLPQNTRAPQWWYSCFQQGHHDMSIYEIEWAYDAFLRFFPNNAHQPRP